MTNASDPNGLERVVERIRERREQGESPSAGDIENEFPEWKGRLSSIVGVLDLLDEFGGEGARGNSPLPDPRTPPGSVFGDFRILREVGRGGMGVVFEAEQLSLGRRVALKILPDHPLLEPARLERFEREAKAAARLHHTNIVPVFFAGVHDRLHFLAMQFIDGPSLRQILDEARREPGLADGETNDATSAVLRSLSSNLASSGGEARGRTAAQYVHAVAEALAHVHDRGVLHRDVKPSNILVDGSGRAWLTDFGLAALHDAQELTTAGDVVGTLSYLAPERLRGQCDARSDVYSLGLVLYELLTGRRAFAEQDRAELTAAIQNREPPRPRSIDPAIPRDLETVTLKAIAKDPADRYQRAADFADDLDRILSGRPISARRNSILEQFRRWKKRNPSVFWLTAAVILVLASSTAVVSLQWRNERRLSGDLKDAKDRAEGRLGWLQDVVSALSTEVREFPGNDPLRRKLLEALADVHRAELERSGGSSESRLELVRLYQQLADAPSKGEPGRGVHDPLQAALLLLDQQSDLSPAVRRREETNIRLNLANYWSELGDDESLGRELTRAEELVAASRREGGDPKYLDFQEGFLSLLQGQRRQTAGSQLKMIGVDPAEDYRAAIDLFDRAASRFESLLQQEPAHSGAHYRLSGTFMERGLTRKYLGDVPGAVADLRRAVEAAERPMPDLAFTRDVRKGAADAWHNLGGVLPAGEAADAYAKAQSSYLKLLLEHPQSAVYRQCLTQSTLGLGSKRRLSKDFKGSEQAYLTGIQSLRAATDPSPSDRQLLARLLVHCGMVVADQKRYAEARRLHEEGATIAENLLKERPEGVDYLETYSFALSRIARARAEPDAEAVALLQKAIELRAKALKRDPRNQRIRSFQAEDEDQLKRWRPTPASGK